MEDSGHQVRSGQNGIPVGLLCFAVVLLGALWFVFVWTTNLHEHVVGAVCALATLIFTIAVVRTVGLHVEIRLRDLVQGWRIPGYILLGLWDITLVLIKDVLGIEPAQSLYRVSGFDSSKHDPVRIARTVMAVAFTTATPNFIVIGIEPSLSRMLFYQIRRTPVPKMTRELGARP